MAVEKLLVRNISSQVIDWLKHLSDKNERSLEAEARNALSEYVEARAIRESVSSRAADVGKRLTELLARYNESYNVPRYTISELAVLVGSDLVEPYENYFMGADEAPVSKLREIADSLLCSHDWLIHGKGKIFRAEGDRVPYDPFAALEWFTEGDAVKAVHFVRCDDETGAVVILKVYGDEHNCKVVTTPYHVSQDIGAGGEGDLCHLFLALELLYKYYCKAGSKLFVSSYLVSRKAYTELYEGNTHPLTIIKNASRSMWWEEIWDRDMSARNTSYWTGWPSLVKQIHSAMDSVRATSDMRERIKETNF